jgi:hypothetical protein
LLLSSRKKVEKEVDNETESDQQRVSFVFVVVVAKELREKSEKGYWRISGVWESEEIRGVIWAPLGRKANSIVPCG